MYTIGKDLNAKLIRETHKQTPGKTEFKEIEKRYKSLIEFTIDHFKKSKLSHYFNNSETPLIQIKTQGSFALKNATKKYKNDKEQDYNDLDLSMIFASLFKNVPALELVEITREALEAYAIKHGLKVDDNDRCLHLIYKDITFDILVAVENDFNNFEIFVAQKEDDGPYFYKIEKPHAFVSYYNNIADSDTIILNEINLKKDSIEAEELETIDGYLGIPRYVDVFIKNHRNTFFKGNGKKCKSVKSIMISTLSITKFNKGKTFIELINEIITFIDYNISTFGNIIVVNDPVDGKENYAAYLNEDLKKRENFKKWFNKFKQDWDKIKQQDSLIDLSNSLNPVFGEYATNRRLNEFGTNFNEAVSSGNVHMCTGGGITIGKKSQNSVTMSNNKNWSSIQSVQTKMKDNLFLVDAKSYSEQDKCIRQFFPQFKLLLPPTNNWIEWHGYLTSPISNKQFRVVIKHSYKWSFPRVYVEGTTNSDKHIHQSLGNCLCLFLPKYKTWNHSMSFSKTIIPWTLNWIIQTEIERLTGQFNGLEEKH
jgi:hypothetical protein